MSSLLRRLVAVWPYAVLLVIALAFRLPPLINARGVHSDAAIVGLQAMHMLEGEFSPFLWGTGYQGSVEAIVVALGFRLFGTSALVMMLVTLAGYCLVLTLAFSTLSRHLTRGRAFLATLLIVLTPHAINTVTVFPPRQWSIVFVFLAVWLIDGAARGRLGLIRLFAGAVLALFATYVDLFVLQVIPAVVIFGLLSAFDSPAGMRRAAHIGVLTTGLIAGAFVVISLRGQFLAGGATAVLFDQLGPNFVLLWKTCLPFLLGYGVQIPGAGLYPDLWVPAAPLRFVQTAAGMSLLLSIGSAAVFFAFRRLPLGVRRLGMLGLLAALSSIGSFLLSVMPSDVWSTRYLAPIIWFAPFAVAPLLAWLNRRVLAVALGPYLAVAAIGGWVSYGDQVSGWRPVQSARGAARDEAQLAQFLRRRDIRFAAAQYWLAYRLTFLFEEDPIVAPMPHPYREERYPPYVRGFRDAPIVAYIFHPSEPRMSVVDIEPWLRRHAGVVERHEIAGFTVLIHARQ